MVSNVIGPVITSVIAVLNLQGATIEAFKWGNSASMQEGNTLNVCTGQNATFPVRGILAAGETVLSRSVKIYKKKKPGPSRNNVHTTAGGLTVSDVQSSDSGVYSLRVTVRSQKPNVVSVTNYTLNRLLQVIRAPEIHGGHLNISLMNDMSTNKNGTRYIVLSCGNFTSLGFPSVFVSWKEPSGTKLRGSSWYKNGAFYLAVGVQSEAENTSYIGTYTCTVEPTRNVALRCLSGKLADAAVTVTLGQVQRLLEAAREKEAAQELTKYTWHH